MRISPCKTVSVALESDAQPRGVPLIVHKEAGAYRTLIGLVHPKAQTLSTRPEFSPRGTIAGPNVLQVTEVERKKVQKG
jgi:hypothetical protein